MHFHAINSLVYMRVSKYITILKSMTLKMLFMIAVVANLLVCTGD